MTTLDAVRRKATEEAMTLIPRRGKPGVYVPEGRPQRKAGFYLIDGVSYPSVTTILQVLAKPALIKWAAKQGAKAVLLDPVKYDTPEAAAKALYEIKDEATSRGKDAHKVAEDFSKAFARGEGAAFASDDPYFPAIKAFFAEMRPEIIAAEVVLVSEANGYAGTADLLAKIGERVFVIDWKTSRFVYDEYPLQLEAYRNAEFGITEDGSRFGQLVSGAMADAGAVVLLRDNGTYQWSPVSAPIEAFKAARTLWLWKQSLNGD